MPSPALPRRDLLSLLGLSLAAAPFAPAPSVAAPAGGLDLAMPKDNVRAIVKLTGDTAGATTYSFTHGTVHAIQSDAIAVPIVNYQAARKSEFRAREGGVYEFRFLGMILYTDPASGAFVETIDNPLTGKRVAVKHWRSSIGRYYYTPDGTKPVAAFEGTAGADHKGKPYILPWIPVADELHVTLDERVRYKRPSDGQWIVDNAIMRYAGPRAALLDEATTSVDCTSSWATAISAFPWLELNEPGRMLLQSGAGRKVKLLTDLPGSFRAFAEKIFPGALEAPIAWG
jgi:hypothetical protein